MDFALQPSRQPPHFWDFVAVYAATLFAVVLPLKIWNNTRNENKLEQQQSLLMQPGSRRSPARSTPFLI